MYYVAQKRIFRGNQKIKLLNLLSKIKQSMMNLFLFAGFGVGEKMYLMDDNVIIINNYHQRSCFRIGFLV